MEKASQEKANARGKDKAAGRGDGRLASLLITRKRMERRKTSPENLQKRMEAKKMGKLGRKPLINQTVQSTKEKEIK